MDITHDNVCSSMLSCFYSHLLSTGRPISSFFYFTECFYILGKVIHDMDYLECYNQAMEFHDEVQANIFLENSENSGFLFVFPTSQCLKKIVDKKEYLFGILVQKSEVPWAKALPLRLKLRLGAEFKCKDIFIIKNFIIITLSDVSTLQEDTVKFRSSVGGKNEDILLQQSYQRGFYISKFVI